LADCSPFILDFYFSVFCLSSIVVHGSQSPAYASFLKRCTRKWGIITELNDREVGGSVASLPRNDMWDDLFAFGAGIQWIEIMKTKTRNFT